MREAWRFFNHELHEFTRIVCFLSPLGGAGGGRFNPN